MIQFSFLYLFHVNDNHGTFFNGRIRFLVQSNRLRIDTGTWLLTEWKSGLRIADELNRTELLIVTATDPHCCCFAATTRWLVAIINK